MADQWKEALAELQTLDQFNHLALALARERRGDFARYVAAEATRRGYRWHGDKATGQYVDLEPGEFERITAEMERRERRVVTKRLAKTATWCKVPSVKVAWEEWVYRGGEKSVGALLIMDFRKGTKTAGVLEIDGVPEELYRRLFHSDAKTTLKQIFTMFEGQEDAEIRDWKQAI